MYIGRILCGLTVGLNTTLIPLYIKEMSPTEMSGKTGSFNQLFVTIGVLLTSLFGTTLGNAKEDNKIAELYIMFLFPIILLLLRAILLMTKYNFETPNYYVIKKNDFRAKNVLKLIYNEKAVEK